MLIDNYKLKHYNIFKILKIYVIEFNSTVHFTLFLFVVKKHKFNP